MGKKRRGINDHHLIQKMDGGSNDKENIKSMKIHKHDGLHMLCGTDYTLPSDKVSHMFELHRSVIQADVYQEINKILNEWKLYGRDAYNLKCIKDIDKFDRRVQETINKIKY